MNILLCFLLLSSIAHSQEVSINIGKNQIALNETFSISIIGKNTEIKDYSDFPDIPGFRKLGISSSSSYQIINGQSSSEQSLKQGYRAEKEGRYKLSPFAMVVNGKKVQSPGTTITVGPAQQQRRNSYSPFDRFDFPSEEEEFVDIEDNAFYSVSTNKSQVYRGEGFTLTGALYIPTNLGNIFALPQNLIEQLQDITKKVSPNSCWEERFEIQSFQPERVTIKDNTFLKIILFQSQYFPFKTEDITIPSTQLNIVKYQVSTRQSFFGRSKKPTEKSYWSKAKKVKVKELPEHPLRNTVSVGNYRLAENTSKTSLETNQNLRYTFKIFGEGNINTITEPTLKNNEDLSIFPPNTQQSLERSNGVIRGEKTFLYNIIPQEPGTYDLSEIIEWIYFNPRTAKYDTLRPSTSFVAQGESRKNANIAANNFGSFYNNLDRFSNKVQSFEKSNRQKIIINVILGSIFVLLGIVVVRKKKQNG